MAKIIIGLALTAFLAGCATYTERTSPCVCEWESINSSEEVIV